jgi:hypothetical protein
MSDEPGGAGSGQAPAGLPVTPTTSQVASAGKEVVSPSQGVIVGVGNVVNNFVLSPDALAFGAGVAIYSKAFLEALGKSSGEGVADLPKRIADHLRVRTLARKGKPDEYVIQGKYEPAGAMIVVTEDLPDEARLALLDLDVTGDEVRGKTLRWNRKTGAWLPEDEATPTA